MAKLAVFALLGMIALAAALDAETMGKKYKDEEEKPKEYKDYKETGVTLFSTEANVKAKHQVWDLLEVVGKTHPCAPEYEILGSTVAQEATLINGDMPVGSVTWTGIVAKHEKCADCKDYKMGAEHHVVKNNYQVVFEFTKMHEGQLTAAVVADSIFSEAEVVLAVTGGTGVFNGAWGTVTWTYGTQKSKSKYTFDVYLPTIVDVTTVKEVKAIKEVEKPEYKDKDYKSEHEYYRKEHDYDSKYDHPEGPKYRY